MVYLGSIISDKGDIKHDVMCHANSKRANLTIKYNNFCSKNNLAPLDIKIKVLDNCVTASLIYSCETWGDNLVAPIETIYRQGLKRGMSVRQNVNNEIVYVECDRFPLTIRIKKQQLHFWKSIQTILIDKHHHLTRFITLANNLNLPYIKYYKNLETSYGTPKVALMTSHQDYR